MIVIHDSLAHFDRHTRIDMTEINKNFMESCSNQQRILITGVSGLIGAILFNHLTENYSRKYQVVGLDQHVNLSTRYQSTNVTSQEIKKVLPIPADKFFQCDITDRMKLHKIIEEQKIDIIIHLAALLEYHPDLENLSYVNINGTKNVFEARTISSKYSFLFLS